MQNNNNIKTHPLWSRAWDLLYLPDKTEEFNYNYVLKWLEGSKTYFNGLSPLQMWEEDQKEVIDYIDYLSRGEFE